MESTMADHEVAGVLRGRTGGTLPGVAPANAYPTADGVEILIAGNADSVFARLCGLVGRTDLVADPRFATHVARGAHAEELDRLVGAWTSGLEAEAALALLAGAGVPAGRVYTAADMVTDAHYAARDMVLRRTARAGFDLPMTGIVPRFSRTPGAVRDVGPALGEHSAEVAAELAAAGGPAAGGSDA
jgi:crotonobetainyl-CoA:carnitine CoA-transferase CaiB-like acyl-CoA transferase